MRSMLEFRKASGATDHYECSDCAYVLSPAGMEPPRTGIQTSTALRKALEDTWDDHDCKKYPKPSKQ